MKYITDKISWSESMKNHAESKLKDIFDNKIDSNMLTAAEFKLSKLNSDKIKVTITIGNYSAQEISEDFYAAITAVCKKIKSIIIKNRQREKYINKDQKSFIYDDIDFECDNSEVEDYFVIAKEKIFDLNPIHTKDAIINLDKTDNPFYVYKDISENNNICVIYRRYNGTLGRIICK